jgi:hypothetical protein
MRALLFMIPDHTSAKVSAKLYRFIVTIYSLYIFAQSRDEPDGADVRETAIHRRVSKLNYSWRYAEASALLAHIKQGLPLAPGIEIGYVVMDVLKWEVDPERIASEFDVDYYRVVEKLGKTGNLEEIRRK